MKKIANLIQKEIDAVNGGGGKCECYTYAGSTNFHVPYPEACAADCCGLQKAIRYAFDASNLDEGDVAHIDGFCTNEKKYPEGTLTLATLESEYQKIISGTVC
jgi:hypothetical protein